MIYCAYMYSIYFVRHGESQANQQKIYAGTLDSPLTSTGRLQAHETAHILKDMQIKHIITSGLSRASDTALIIKNIIDPQNVITMESKEFLNEIYFGDIQGKPYGDISGLEYAISSKTGESLDELYERGLQAVAHLKTIAKDGNILVVGHGTFSAIIFALIENINKEDFIEYRKNFKFHNGEIKKLPCNYFIFPNNLLYSHVCKQLINTSTYLPMDPHLAIQAQADTEHCSSLNN